MGRFRLARFILLFAILYAILFWLLIGSGPVRFLNTAIHGLTRGQTVLAGEILQLLGEPVTATGTALGGGGFACDVAEGCNGMSALTLLLAGLLAFPAPWRARGLGAFVLIPAVLLVNLIRIVGLYEVGAHCPSHFALSHVYGGQVFVILATAGGWWGWLTWVSRSHAQSS